MLSTIASVVCGRSMVLVRRLKSRIPPIAISRDNNQSTAIAVLRETDVTFSAKLDALRFNGLPNVLLYLPCHTVCRGDFESSLVFPKLKTNMATRRPNKRLQSGLHIPLNSKPFLTVLHR